MIELRNVVKVYQAKKGSPTMALKNINLTLKDKGVVFILGKSGSGKSTLLNIIGGLDSVTSGEVLLDGNNICAFQDKELDGFRNSYVGFVFQEFNVLDTYNVYQNVELALKLQNQKGNQKVIDETLEKLKISSLKKRKMNELSGGQKQKVAIARALVKNPKIILADEPTGSLDSKSGQQIFEILKSISRKHLVVVVSHNKEAAKLYADRIITIQDGEIIHDTNPFLTTEKKNFTLKKSHLPFSYAVRMALSSLKMKPLKLFMTILLTCISLIFMAFTLNCAWFNEKDFEVSMMKDNKSYAYSVYQTTVTKRGQSIEYKKNLLALEDFNQIEDITKNKVNPVYRIWLNGEGLNFTYGKKSEIPSHLQIPINPCIVEVKDNRVIGPVWGGIPENEMEVVIHPYLADYMVAYGVETIDNELYFPADWESLLKDKKSLKLGENAVKIVGIQKIDTSMFDEVRKGAPFSSQQLYNEYYTSYIENASYIYGKGFTDTVQYTKDDDAFLSHVTIGQNSASILPNSFFSEPVEVITSTGKTSISSLQKNEIILSFAHFKQYASSIEEELDVYLHKHKNEVYKTALENFLMEYIKEHDSLSNLSLKIKNALTNQSIDVTVVGVSLQDKTYISKECETEYERVRITSEEVRVYDDDTKHLKEVFTSIPFTQTIQKPGEYYSFSIINNGAIAEIVKKYDYLKKYLFLFSLVFLLFGFLLFSNFLGVSISYSKKEIGILRALGATRKDVIKIFFYEAFFIGVIAWFFSMLGFTIICHVLNQHWFKNLYYVLKGIILNPFIPPTIFLYVMAIAAFITILLVGRITRIRPIDAILEK